VEKYTVSKAEVLRYKHVGEGMLTGQLILSMLQEKGAPIKGALILVPDYMNYNIESYYDQINQEYVFTFVDRRCK
jgi:hypothetical protein